MSAGLRSKQADWIVVRNNSVHCERCKTSQEMPLPMELSKLPGWLNSFREKHLHCEEEGAE